jgi:Ca-activated chloride channel family protein
VIELCLALGLIVWVGEARAADRETQRRVAQANRTLSEGKADEALKIYDQAAEKAPDSPELAYNRGVAYYRKGDLTKAAECFTKATTSRDIRLEARARFNLGNCAYAEALARQGELKTAMEKLRVAIAHYKDAIAANPADLDAKVNMETAQLFMKHLLDQEKKRREEEKKNPQSQPESQPESQPASRPEQPQSRPESQPEQSPQSQPASRPDSGEPRQKDEQDRQGQDKQDKQGGQGEEQKQNEQGKQLEAGDQKHGDKDQQEQAARQAGEAQMREMSPEEAEKLLQTIRDRERQRREAQLRLFRSRQVPTSRDW